MASVFILFSDSDSHSDRELETVGTYYDVDDAHMNAWFRYMEDFVSYRPKYPDFYIEKWSTGKESKLLNTVDCDIDYDSNEYIEKYSSLYKEYIARKQKIKETKEKNREYSRICTENEKRRNTRLALDHRLMGRKITSDEYFEEVRKLSVINDG